MPACVLSWSTLKLSFDRLGSTALIYSSPSRICYRDFRNSSVHDDRGQSTNAHKDRLRRPAAPPPRPESLSPWRSVLPWNLGSNLLIVDCLTGMSMLHVSFPWKFEPNKSTYSPMTNRSNHCCSIITIVACQEFFRWYLVKVLELCNCAVLLL